MTPKVFYNDNDHYLEVLSVQNGRTGAYINDAVIEVTLLDLEGNEIVGMTWPASLAYVAASDGDYYVQLDAELDTDDLENGVALISVTSPLIAEFNLPIDFKDRTDT